jgi:hypothetical protein
MFSDVDLKEAGIKPALVALILDCTKTVLNGYFN